MLKSLDFILGTGIKRNNFIRENDDLRFTLYNDIYNSNSDIN